MRSVCNIRLPQDMGDVISSIGIGTAVANSMGYGRQHGIGLVLFWSFQNAIATCGL